MSIQKSCERPFFSILRKKWPEMNHAAIEANEFSVIRFYMEIFSMGSGWCKPAVSLSGKGGNAPFR
ncbi:hypothetical protein DESC_360002 [Desulfosarcina cetonica]|nr:hypothetical protein DESC_360002 [Desulfosarcina cetonica]